MINTEANKWIPSPGYLYVSNGEVWSDSIYLGKDDRIENWHDTNEEPPEPDEEISNEEALAILLGGIA